MLSSKYISTFKKLVETGNFTKTAQKLHMTQPGVSQHIQKLEDDCGHLLIRRIKKSFELTEQGKEVYEYAKLLGQNENELLERLNFDAPYKGQYKLACSGAMALNLYPFLINLQSVHPELLMQLTAAPNQQILKNVQDGEVDVGIVTQVMTPSLYDAMEIGQEQLCLVFPSKTKLKADTRELLCQTGLIDHPDAEHYLSIYFSQCQVSSLANLNTKDIPKTGYINQINQILHPVANGCGFTILPKSVLDNFSEPEKIALYQPGKIVKEPLFLVKKKFRVLPKRFTTVNRALESFFNCSMSQHFV